MNSSVKIIFQKERKTTKILSDAFIFFKSNFKDLFTLNYKIILPFFILALLSSAYNSFYIHNFSVGVNNFYNYLFIYSFQQLTVLLFISIVQASILTYIKLYKDDNFDTEIVYNPIVFKSFFPLLKLNISVVVLTLIASVFFIIPGIYLHIVLLLSPVILLYQNLNIPDTIKESFKLIKNNWGSVFSILFLLLLILISTSLFFQLITILYSSFNSLFFEAASINTNNNPFSIFIFILSFSIYLLLYVYVVIVYAMMYFNIIEKKEHNTLYSEVDKIGLDIEK